ncbi:MAG: DNA recombination protein RmuC [Patescibacteria group bacterium]|nr:DNA recombination protein RmuC [Patescibacteria group bacterium]
MENILLIILIILVLILLFLVFKKLYQNQNHQSENQALLLLQNQINDIIKTLDKKLGESTQVIYERMSESSKITKEIIKEVTQELTKLNEGQRQVNNLADQLKILQDILKNPKQRGLLGEYLLENTLKNILPPTSYQMQYPFSDGLTVDAVIFYGDKIIPIDSKFSLENYNRLIEAKTNEEIKKFEDALRNDLKNRIDETSKYIKPEEGTFEFALMYIPSEALYYDLLVNKVGSLGGKNLIEYAYQKKINIVSPTSFQAYLNTILLGLHKIQFNKSTEKIIKNINQLKKHLITYEEFLKKLGNHINITMSTYNKAYDEFQKIDKDIYKITGETIEEAMENNLFLKE